MMTLGLSSGRLLSNTLAREVEVPQRWNLMGKVTQLYQLVIATLKTLIWLELATCELIVRIRVRLVGIRPRIQKTMLSPR